MIFMAISAQPLVKDFHHLRADNIQLEDKLLAEKKKNRASQTCLSKIDRPVAILQSVAAEFKSGVIEVDKFSECIVSIVNKINDEIRTLEIELSKSTAIRSATNPRVMTAAELLPHMQIGLVTSWPNNEKEMGDIIPRLEERNAELNELIDAEQNKAWTGAHFIHNTRTPISILMNGIQLLSLGPGIISTMPDFSGMITRAAQSLADEASLLRDHLGEQSFKVSAFNIREHMEGIIQSLSGLCEHDQKISANYFSVPDRLYCVSEMVDSAVRNFVKNAIEVSSLDPQNPTMITINVTWDNAAKDLNIAVTDSNGAGFAPEEGEKLFDHQVRLGNKTNEGTAGEGIGLHSIRNNLGSIGGRCGCLSPGKDQGATFWLSVPATKKGPRPALTIL